MCVKFTCEAEEDSIINVDNTIFFFFFKHSGAAKSAIGSGRNILHLSEILCLSLLPASMKKDSIQYNRENVLTPLSPLWGFFKTLKQSEMESGRN